MDKRCSKIKVSAVVESEAVPVSFGRVLRCR